MGRDGEWGDLSIEGDSTPEVRDAALDLWGDKPALVFGRWSVPYPVRTRMMLTWDKGGVGMGDLSVPWTPDTEQIYVLGSGFAGSRGSSVLRGNVPPAKYVGRCHPTEKPIGLMRALIAKCPPGIIVDPFMGSGTTLRAAKDLGRQAIGIEVDESYCRTAVARLGQEVLAL